MKRTGFASWQVLAALVVLAIVLVIFQRATSARDVDVATDPPNPAQRAFFESAASRPDLELFFKALPRSKKLQMARNLGDHATPNAAKVAAKLLSTFDEQAREALIASLSKLAATNPALVAGELGLSGSYQRIGVYRALRSAGDRGTHAAAAALADPARKSNAVRYLVQLGPSSIPHVLPLLNEESEGTRSAAAETLGKLRSIEAVAPILSKLPLAKGEERLAKGEERSAYIASLADIGDRRAEESLIRALEGATPGESARIMGGLGRIATPRSMAQLVRIHKEGSSQTKDAALTGLVLSGDTAFAHIEEPKLRLEIAARVHTKKADETIRGLLSHPSLSKSALKAATGREQLASALWPQSANPDSVALRMEILASTKAGNRILQGLSDDPVYGGYAKRALELSTISEN
jgi:HEAT repeat protein